MNRAEKERAKHWRESLLKYTVDNPDEWVECQICGARCSFLIGTHLPRSHSISLVLFQKHD
jgi:hypothetical protein